jgi:hypothetical protein
MFSNKDWKYIYIYIFKMLYILDKLFFHIGLSICNYYSTIITRKYFINYFYNLFFVSKMKIIYFFDISSSTIQDNLLLYHIYVKYIIYNSIISRNVKFTVLCKEH